MCILLIKLQSEDSVKAVLSAAKSLRHCDDKYVRQSVYINADLSPAEAKLAYKKRQRRREQIARRQAETLNVALSPKNEATDTTVTGTNDLPVSLTNTDTDDTEVTFKVTPAATASTLQAEHPPTTANPRLSTTDGSSTQTSVQSGESASNQPLFQ